LCRRQHRRKLIIVKHIIYDVEHASSLPPGFIHSLRDGAEQIINNPPFVGLYFYLTGKSRTDGLVSPAHADRGLEEADDPDVLVAKISEKLRQNHGKFASLV
jgi:hypothetical protein